MRHVIWMGMLLAGAAMVPVRAAGQDVPSAAGQDAPSVAGHDVSSVPAAGPLRQRFNYSVPADSADSASRADPAVLRDRLRFSRHGAAVGQGIGCALGGLGFAASSTSDSLGGVLFQGLVGCVVGAVPGFLLGGLLIR